MVAYYNENDAFSAEWLKQLVSAGEIPKGYVDTRSIKDVTPSDLHGFDQCHFFAGIGVWAYALKRAGWSDSTKVWTGSCPCQPFSVAGKCNGVTDERHLWPQFFKLIDACKPECVFGEQVSSRGGLAWFDIVSTDLESAGYTCGALDICAASVGAPHIRQRLYWVASRWDFSWMGNSSGEGLERWCEYEPCEERREITVRSSIDASIGLDSAYHDRFWADTDFVFCRDGKWRPIEPGSYPLANGAAARMGRLRGYGNALVTQQAEAFIRAYMGVLYGS